MDEQTKKLDRGVDVLIATPGRLLDHFERGRILLNDIKILSSTRQTGCSTAGFIPDVEKIVSCCRRSAKRCSSRRCHRKFVDFLTNS